MTNNGEPQEQLSPMLPMRNTENNGKEFVDCSEISEALHEGVRRTCEPVSTSTAPCPGSEAESGSVGCSHPVKWICAHLAPDVLCHTPTMPLTLLSIFTLLLLLWGTLRTLFPDLVFPLSIVHFLILGYNFILSLIFVFYVSAILFLSYIAGNLIKFLKLPPLLGMLLVGIVVGNVNIFNLTRLFKAAVSTLRSTAMVVIFIKTGLGLYAGALQRLSFVVVRLAFIPCLVEASVVMCVSYFLLDLPWLWGALLGFVLGAVSPAVVGPSLLTLKDQGYGEDKGISTLVIAASSIDNILAISGFGVVLSTLFSEGDLLQQVLQGPLEVCIGLSFGIVWGIVAIYIPHRNEGWVVAGRSLMIGLGGLFAVFGSQLVGYPGAGPLASIVMAFVACYGWKNQGWSATENPVETVFSSIWQFFEHVLFGLIGTAINLSTLEVNAVSYRIATLSVGLTIRLITSFLVVSGGSLNLKEMLFVAISWFPKATVQAAIGPVALDLANKWDSEETVIEYATLVLTTAVLSIILTAPIGAIGIYVAGPRLLGKVQCETEQTPNTIQGDPV